MVYTLEHLKSSEIGNMPIYAVIGHPIGHSLSPIMHQTALDYYGIDAKYIALDIPQHKLNEFIPWCNKDHILGCNITIPHKKVFSEIVDELDPVAQKVGVVNTLVKKDFKLFGYNTDVYGFLKPLKPYFSNMDFSRAIIFGTGGASKAIKIGLESEGFDEIIFVSRNPKTKFIDSDHSDIRLLDYNQWQSYSEGTELFINTTPVGMYPMTNETFLRQGEAELFDGKICYDLIYNPGNTIFLKQAKDHGATVINGLDMLIHQGSKSFELWTGQSFPIDKIRETLLKKLESTQ